MLRSTARIARLASNVAPKWSLSACAPARGFIASVPTAAPRDYQHLPLGQVPEGTAPEFVREKWGSNAMDLINEAEVIEVDGPIAICDGGGGALGHPIEYIRLDVSDEDAAPRVCKYCGTRYKRKKSA